MAYEKRDKITDVMLKYLKAKRRADDLARELYPIGSTIHVYLFRKDSDPPNAPKVKVKGTVRAYYAEPDAGIVVEFPADVAAEFSKPWHLHDGLINVCWTSIAD